MALQPGFLDEGGGRERPDAVVQMAAESMAASPSPMLIDAPGAAAGDRIDHGWAPEMIRPPRVRRGSLSWLAGGLAVLVAGWVGLSASALVYDQFARSARLGAVTLAVFLVAAGLIARGVLMELRTYAALRRIDGIRAALARPDVPLADAKRLCGSWLDVVGPRLPNPAAVRSSVMAASDLTELRVVLRSRVLAPLDQAARQVAHIGAAQGAAAVAIVPSPALDGLFAGLRGLSLIRQVAQIYGLRPGLAVTLSLFRRVSWTAASVMGTDLLAQAAVERVLHGLPVIKHLAAAVPGTSIAAFRLYRLGIITAKACSPLAEQ